MIDKTSDGAAVGALAAGLATGVLAATGAAGTGIIGGAVLRATPLKRAVPPLPVLVPLGLAGGALVGAVAGLAAAAAVGVALNDKTPRG